MFLPSIRKEKNQVTLIAKFIVLSSLLAIVSLSNQTELLLLKTSIKLEQILQLSLVFIIYAANENNLHPIKIKASLWETDNKLYQHVLL